jgi:GGDEF domain-containing protein
MADWNDPIAQAMAQRASDVPAPNFQGGTPAGDAQAQQNQQQFQPSASASVSVSGGAMGTPSDQDRPTLYGYNPQTHEVLVNGQKIGRDFSAWSAAANLPPDQIKPMSVNAISQDGFIPLSQDQFKAFIQGIDQNAQGRMVGNTLHNLFTGAEQTAAGGGRLALRSIGGWLDNLTAPGRAELQSPEVQQFLQNHPTLASALNTMLSIPGQLKQQANDTTDFWQNAVQQQDQADRAGESLQQQAYADQSFANHPVHATLNTLTTALPQAAPALAAFAMNPGLGTLAMSAQGNEAGAEEASARFQQATAGLTPDQFTAANPQYAQLRAQGLNDTQARDALRQHAMNVAGDVTGAMSALTAPLMGRIPLAAIGRAQALMPGIGGSGVGGWLGRRLAMAAGTSAENALLTAATNIPGQVAGDVASGRGIQGAGDYAQGIGSAALVGALLGGITRAPDRVATTQASDIGAAANTVHAVSQPRPQQPPVGMVADMFGTAPPSQPGEFQQRSEPAPAVQNPAQGDLLQPQQGQVSDLFNSAPPSAPTSDVGAPQAPAQPAGGGPAQPDLLPPAGPAPAPRVSLIQQRAMEQARPQPQGIQGALPAPPSIEALNQARDALQGHLDGLQNQRSKVARQLKATIEQIDAQIKQRDSEELAAQIARGREARMPQDNSIIGNPQTGQHELFENPGNGQPDLAPAGNTQPPPIGQEQPMSVEEAQARLQALRARNPQNQAPQSDMFARQLKSALQQHIEQSQNGTSPSTAEPVQDLQAQMQALKDGTRDAVFVAAGNEAQAPKVSGKVARTITRPEGTLVTTNAAKAKAYREAPQVNDELLARLQDLPQSKADALQQGDNTVTQAVDQNGAVVKEALGSGNADAVAQAAPPGGAVRQLSAEEAQARRQELNQRFDAGEALSPEDAAELVRLTRDERDMAKPGQQPLQGMLNGDAGPRAAEAAGHKGYLHTDMNGLKRINDTFGHGAGDSLLRSFATLYRDIAAKHGGLSWLAGGDEFVSSYPTRAAAVKAHAELQRAAKNHVVEFQANDGTVHRVEGVGFAGGVGKNVREADSNSEQSKRAQYAATGAERRGVASDRRAQESVNEPARQSDANTGRAARQSQGVSRAAQREVVATATKSAALKERAAAQRAAVTDEAKVNEAIGKKKVPASQQDALNALRKDVEANHPQYAETFEQPTEREGAGRRPESPLTAVPMTEHEMGALAEHTRAVASSEASELERGTWSPKNSQLARILEAAGARPSDTQLRRVVADMAKATPEQLRGFIEAAGPRLADSTLAKGIVRGMDNVRAAVRDHGGSSEPLDAYEGKVVRSMDVGASAKNAGGELPEKNELYSRGRVTMYGKDLPPQVGEAVREWTRTFEKSSGRFLPDEMHVMTPDQARALYGAAAVPKSDAFSGELKNPVTGKMDHVIAVDWKALGDGAASVETLAHEFAHTAMDSVFDQLPKADQTAVRQAYNEWLQAQGRGTPTETMLKRLPPALADVLRETGATPDKAYAESWHEWIADEVAKWMMTDQRPRTAVERFFSHLADIFQKLYAAVTGRGRPTDAVATMMDNLVERSRNLRAADATARANDMAYGREPVEPSPAPEATRQKIDLSAVKQRADKIVEGSKALASDLGKTFDNGPAAIKDRINQTWSRVAEGRGGDIMRNIAHGLMSTRDIVDRYRGRGRFGEGLVDWDNAQRMAEKLGREVQQQANIASERAQRLSAPVKRALNQLMYKTTVYGIHPDEAFGTGRNAHLQDPDKTVTDSNRARYNEVRAAWKQLEGIPGDPQGVYQQLRDALATIRRETFTARHANIDKLDVSSDAKAEMHALLAAQEERTLEGPYFPLTREGNYITTAMMPAKNLGEAQTKAEAMALGAREKAVNPHAEIMLSKTPDGTWSVHAGEKAVYFHPTLADAKAARAGIETEMREAWQHLAVDLDQAQTELGNKPIFEGPFHTQDFFQKMEVPNLNKFTAEINKLRDAGKLDPEVYKKFSEMVLESLPETSPRKSMMQRQNIRGANQDMLSGYVRHVAGAAHTFGKTKMARDINDAWALMNKHSREQPELNTVMNNLMTRQTQLAKRMERNWQNTTASTIQDISSLMSLGFSPAFMVQQALQPAILTLPVLAARAAQDGRSVGYGNAMKYMKEAYNGAVPFFSKRGAEQFMAEAKRMLGTYSGDGKTLQESAEDMMNTFGKTADEKDMLHYLNARGTLDFAFLNAVNDAAGLSKIGNKTKAALRISMAIPQQIEAMNRMVSGLATYRLARDVRGLDHAAAMHEADTVVAQTHGDYSRYNRPSVFNRPWVGMALQFKMYTQFIYSLLIRNMANMMDRDLSREERAQAARTLGYVIGSHAGFGGAIGLGPIAGAAKFGLGGLMYAMAGAGLIDKKKKDQTIGDWIQADFEKWGDEQMGPGTGRYLRQLAQYGVPGAAGIDIADKIGIPDLTTTHFGGNQAKNAGGAMDQMLIAAAGPAYANMKRIVNGTEQLLDGNLQAAGKQMLPAAPRALLNAITEQQDGVVTASGNVIRPAADISPYRTFLRALGLQDPETEMRYEDRSALADAKARIKDDRNAILQAYAAAKTADERHSVMQRVADFNQGRPAAFQISGATLKRQLQRLPESKNDQALARELGQ